MKGTCVHTSAAAQCYWCKTPTVAVITPTTAALYIVLQLLPRAPLQPPTAAALLLCHPTTAATTSAAAQCYCCKTPNSAVITPTTAALYFVLPLLPRAPLQPATATPPQLLHSTHLYAEPGK